MFLSKGLSYLLGKRSTDIDVNSLPDIDSPKDVRNFMDSIKDLLREWKNIEELKIIIEFLVDASEKYDIIETLGEIWLGSLQNSLDSEILQQMHDITLNSAEKNPQFFNVILI